MSEKIRILADSIISRAKNKVKYYAADGSIKTDSTKVVQIFDNQEELDTAVSEAALAAPGAVEGGAPEEISNGEQSAASTAPAATGSSSKSKRGKGKGKEQMATKKKAGKKAAKKGVRAASNGALIRTVAGREHDISGYEKVKNASGHTSYDNGDDVATLLRGKTLDEVYATASKKLKEPEKDLRAKYKHLNAGMQRMSLGNRLRKVLNEKAAA